MGHRGTYWRNVAASAFIFLTVQALVGATVEAIQKGKLLLLVELILFEAGIGLVICGILLRSGENSPISSKTFVTPMAQRAVPGDIWRRAGRTRLRYWER